MVADKPKPMPGKGFSRDTTPKTATQPMTTGDPEDYSFATGRGFRYEWEEVAEELENRIDAIKQGGGGGSGGTLAYHQDTPSATWTITHDLGPVPMVTVVDIDGQEVFAEVDYPDDSTVQISFSQPAVGTAYLRG